MRISNFPRSSFLFITTDRNFIFLIRDSDQKNGKFPSRSQSALFLYSIFKKLFCVLFVVAHFFAFPTSFGSEDAITIIRKMTTEYNVLSGPSYDVLSHLKMISENSKLLLRLTGPAGSVLAACLEVALPPENPMMKALAEFHTWMERKFVEQNNVIEKAMSSIRLAHDLKDFDNNVDIPLAYMYTILDITTSSPKQTAKQRFINTCTHPTSSPIKVLEYLNENVNRNCQIMSKKKARMIGNLKSLFAEVFSRFGEQKFTNEFYQFEAIYFRVIEKFVQISETDAIKSFIKIRDLIENSKFDEELRLIDLQFSLSKSFNDTLPEICFLRVVYEGYELRRDAILKMAEIIKMSTTKSALLAGMCSNASNSGDDEAVTRELEMLALYTSQISGNVSMWIANELENAWPFAIEAIVKSALGITQITDPYSFNKTAELINSEVSSRGSPDYIYNVLVTRDVDRMENIWIRCPPDCCHRVRQFHGINIFIARYPVENCERAHQAESWFANNQLNITEIIRKNDKVSELGTLMNMIENTLGSVTGPSLYHSFVFLHVSTLSQKDSKIETGISNTAYLGHTGFSYLEVFDHHWLPLNEERFGLFLFM